MSVATDGCKVMGRFEETKHRKQIVRQLQRQDGSAAIINITVNSAVMKQID